MDRATSAAPQHLMFHVSGARLALAVDSVRAVIRMPHLSRVPHAPPALLGLANFRGTVIPVLSASMLQGDAVADASRLIVIDAGELLGLAVDDTSHIEQAGASPTTQLIDGAELVARAMPDRAVPRRAYERTTAPPADHADEHATTPLVVFAIGDQEFALAATTVDGVARLPPGIALMPDSDEVVIGSATFHDATLPLLSLRALLALPRSDEATTPRVVVATIGSDRVGLVVDAMRGILQVPDNLIDPIPRALLRGKAEARIHAICRLDQGSRLVSVLTADRLLRDDITAAMLTRTHAEPSLPVAEIRTEQFLIFTIGSDNFGIPLDAVDEVAPLPEKLTRLPNAPAFVLGVMTRRGRIIPVIDQRQRFGAAPVTGTRSRVIVVHIGETQAAFVVDAIAHIARVDAALIGPAPDLGNGETRLFDRVARLEQGIVLIISPRLLLDRTEQDLLLGLTRKRAGGVGAQS